VQPASAQPGSCRKIRAVDRCSPLPLHVVLNWNQLSGKEHAFIQSVTASFAHPIGWAKDAASVANVDGLMG